MTEAIEMSYELDMAWLRGLLSGFGFAVGILLGIIIGVALR